MAGNVRELEAVMRQALLNTTGNVILPDFLPDQVRLGGPSAVALGRGRPTRLPAICVPLSTNACGAGRRKCTRPAWR